MSFRLGLGLCLLLGIGGSIAISQRAKTDLVDARERYRNELREEARGVRSGIETIFSRSHVALRSVARFSELRSYDVFDGFRAEEVRTIPELLAESTTFGSAGEIFEGLAATLGATDLYIAPYPFNPQGLSNLADDIPREPIVHFTVRSLEEVDVEGNSDRVGEAIPETRLERAIATFGMRPQEQQAAGQPQAEGRELWTQQLILNQLQYFAHHLSYFQNAPEAELPALCGELKALLPRGGQNHFTRTDDSGTSLGLVHTSPILDEHGVLAGSVSAVIPWESLRAEIPVEGFVVRHPTRGISIIPEENTTAARSESFWGRGAPDPDLFYSEVFPLQIPDTDQKWELWTGRTGDGFAARGETKAIGAWAAMGHALLWGAMIAVCVGLWRSQRWRQRCATLQETQGTAGVQSAEELREEVDAVHERKDAFLSRITHEVRTPMSSILGFADVLLDSEIDEDQRVEAIQSIRRNGRHLLNMISDVFDLSQVERGKLTLQPLSVRTRTIIEEVVGLMKSRAKARSTQLSSEFRGDVPELIQTDASRVQQALANLVDNAIKHTEGGSVQLIVECDRSKERLRIAVVDNGTGMTSAQVARIFQPFEQTKDSQKTGSTGLGLSLSRQLAELLGGEVRAESSPGKGSKFTLEVATGSLAGVPTMSETPPNRAAEESESWNSLPHIDGRVLLVEDGPDNQTVISHILRRAGAEVVIANNGLEGVEIALEDRREGRPVDAILMDLEMPVLDGLSATRRLREAGFDGQIIALTAHALHDDIDRCVAAGCDHSLTKPVERSVLVHVVAERIGLRSEAKPVPAAPRP